MPCIIRDWIIKENGKYVQKEAVLRGVLFFLFLNMF